MKPFEYKDPYPVEHFMRTRGRITSTHTTVSDYAKPFIVILTVIAFIMFLAIGHHGHGHRRHGHHY